MTTRRGLPNRRNAELLDFECGGFRYTVTVGRFPDGRIAELFLNNGKVGSDSETSARDAAVVCSIACQYGVPIEVIRKALLRDSQGRASSPLGAALDLIAERES